MTKNSGMFRVACGLAALAAAVAIAAPAKVDILDIVRQPIPDRVVVLTFDDALANQATFAAPLLKKYGFGATFFVCQPCAETQNAQRHMMTWEQIRELDRMGFEIGNHTFHHISVKGLPKEKFVSELTLLEERCRKAGVPTPASFCYPGTITDLGDLGALAAKGYQFARCGREHAYHPTSDHPLLVPSFGIHGTDPERFYKAVGQARWGQAAVLMIHGVPEFNSPKYSIEPALFEQYMKYLHDHHYTVIAMRDLARYVDPAKAREWFEEHGYTK